MREFFRGLGAALGPVFVTMGQVMFGHNRTSRYKHRWFYICIFGWCVGVLAISAFNMLWHGLKPEWIAIVLTVMTSFFGGWFNARGWIGLYQKQVYMFEEGLVPRRKKRHDEARQTD